PHRRRWRGDGGPGLSPRPRARYLGKGGPATWSVAGPYLAVMKRTIEVMLVGALVLDVAYWSVWFTSRDTLASEHRAAYYEFENAFPLADAWLGLACLLALVCLRTNR